MLVPNPMRNNKSYFNTNNVSTLNTCAENACPNPWPRFCRVNLEAPPREELCGDRQPVACVPACDERQHVRDSFYDNSTCICEYSWVSVMIYGSMCTCEGLDHSPTPQNLTVVLFSFNSLYVLCAFCVVCLYPVLCCIL